MRRRAGVLLIPVLLLAFPRCSGSGDDPGNDFDSLMDWQVRDACSDGRGIVLRFFDQNNGTVFPSPSEVFVLDPGETRTFRIACRTGNQICYGASPDPPDGSHWGVGINNAFGCDSCCFTCSDTTIQVTLGC